MRNFETPKMNISMFAAENVATTTSGQPGQEQIQGLNAEAARTAFVGGNQEAANRIFEFSY